MEALFTIDNLFSLVMLILLQAVLGFDNLLYISIESKRAPAENQKFVRQMGIGLAIFLRIALLFVLINAIQWFQDSLFAFNLPGIVEGVEENLLCLLFEQLLVDAQALRVASLTQDVGDALVRCGQAFGLFQTGEGLHGGEAPIEV